MTPLSYWMEARGIRNGIFIPKYYDPEIVQELNSLASTHDLVTLGELMQDGSISVATGDEIGSEAYGTGNIPFVRTSDISNWEIKATPKLGVAENIYLQYARKQGVRKGDILLVRDGTYLIGTNCFVTSLDAKLLYQSHILKLRVERPSKISPQALFLALNSSMVQRQIRAVQFTADIIDTIGQRYTEVVLPIPRAPERLVFAAETLDRALETRLRGKCFIRQSPLLMEQALRAGSTEALERFLEADLEEISKSLVQDTISLELGAFEATWLKGSHVKHEIYIPKYYDPEIEEELSSLEATCDLRDIGELKANGILEWTTGDEPGKMAYGTGDVPFLRTSDFANWEIKHDPKHGLAEYFYEYYKPQQDVQPGDVFLVRDGTYLVGASTIVEPGDERLVFCGGLYKLRSRMPDQLSPYLLLALLNSYVVKRQMRARQFTRDVIDTMGRRLDEVKLPIPRSSELRTRLGSLVQDVVRTRVEARNVIKRLAGAFEQPFHA